MSIPFDEYVIQTPQGGWRIAGARVSLDSVVYEYWRGHPPEVIVASFPSLTLEQVHGAIAFYLQHREQVHDYLKKQKALWEEFRRESEMKHGPLLERIRAYRAKRA